MVILRLHLVPSLAFHIGVSFFNGRNFRSLNLIQLIQLRVFKLMCDSSDGIIVLLCFVSLWSLDPRCRHRVCIHFLWQLFMRHIKFASFGIYFLHPLGLSFFFTFVLNINHPFGLVSIHLGLLRAIWDGLTRAVILYFGRIVGCLNMIFLFFSLFSRFCPFGVYFHFTICLSVNFSFGISFRFPLCIAATCPFGLSFRFPLCIPATCPFCLSLRCPFGMVECHMGII